MGIHKELEIEGRFEQGRIVLDKPLPLPEGTRLHGRIQAQSLSPENDRERRERLMALAGSVPDLECPSEAARARGGNQAEPSGPSGNWPEGFFDLAGSAPDLECPPR